MYIPSLPKVLNFRPIVYLDKSQFTLDASGVAGFFGGTEAASAIATAHLFKGRMWLGWYNSPGSYEIAKRYGLLTKFNFFFGGGHDDPAELLALFELDGSKGPQFLRIHSGSVIPETGHLADVFMKKCASLECLTKSKNGRQSVRVTIADLNNGLRDTKVALMPIPTDWKFQLYAAIPIFVSTSTCILSVAARDWYSFSLILLGVIANGVTSLVVGSVGLGFIRPRLAGESIDSRGELAQSDHISGILITATNVVLLKGPEDAAMAVAYGKFRFPPDRERRRLGRAETEDTNIRVPTNISWTVLAGDPFRMLVMHLQRIIPSGKTFHRYIGWCSVLLLVQFIAQLLLIPQGSLFGQIMFVTSLAFSWGYNLWLCSLDKADVQQKILLETILGLKNVDAEDIRSRSLTKFELDSWPAMVTFVLLAMVLGSGQRDERELEIVLKALVEDTSDVWGIWKEAVSTIVRNLNDIDSITLAEDWGITDEQTRNLSPADNIKLQKLLGEAWSGVLTYREYIHLVQPLSKADD